MRRSVTPTLNLRANRGLCWIPVICERRLQKIAMLGAISGAKVGHRPKLDPDGCRKKIPTAKPVEEVVWRAAAACWRGECGCGAQHLLLLLLQVKIKTFGSAGATLPLFPTDDSSLGIQQRPLFSHAPYFIYIIYKGTHTRQDGSLGRGSKWFRFLDVNYQILCSKTKSCRLFVIGRCSNQQNCSILASTSVFGDPCPGTRKYLEAHYQCVPGKLTFDYISCA